jgi:hypothetical protein
MLVVLGGTNELLLAAVRFNYELSISGTLTDTLVLVHRPTAALIFDKF